jgi:hypothetical protein
MLEGTYCCAEKVNTHWCLPVDVNTKGRQNPSLHTFVRSLVL